MQFSRYNTEATFTLQNDSYGYFTSKYKTDEIEQISSKLQKIWTGVINKSLTEGNVIKKDKAFVFFVLETKGKIPIKHETETKKRQPSQLYWEKKDKGEVF